MLVLATSLLRACGLNLSPSLLSEKESGHPASCAVHPTFSEETATSDLAFVEEVIKQFQSEPNEESIARLRLLRRSFAGFILQQVFRGAPPTWPAAFLRMHFLMAQSGLRDMPRDAEDEAFLAGLCTRIVSQCGQPEQVSAILAVMLIAYPHDVPHPPSLDGVEDSFRPSYAGYLLEGPALFNRVNEANEYLEHLRQAVAYIYDYVMHRPRPQDASKIAAVFLDRAFYVQAYFNAANLRTLYRQRGDILSQSMLDSNRPLLALLPPYTGGGKIKLGIYVLRFKPHPESYFMLSHFEHLDRARFDITLFTVMQHGSSLEERCFSAADRAVALSSGDLASQAQQIRAANLDILIFGTNASATVNESSLLAGHRLARIQIASVSSPVTTGMRHMDVLLSAEWNETSPDAQLHYTEYLFRMRGSVNCYAFQYDEDTPTTAPTRKSLGIRDDQLVFFSGANYFKILPELSLNWAHILAAVPDSVLMLMPFNPNWKNTYQIQPLVVRIMEQMSSCGVSWDRVRILMPVDTRADVHLLLELADVYLDAFPFAGACSMLDPLYVGVSPVAWRGNTGRSSHGAAMLKMLDLEELVADSAETYEQLAVKLAKDPAWRSSIRDKLLKARQGASLPPYFDTVDFSNKVGEALEDLFHAYSFHYITLQERGSDDLRAQLQQVADELVGRNRELEGLTDLWIAQYLIMPFLRNAERNGRPPLLIDVGACHGQMSLPFIAEGWHAVLFEPDPDARSTMESCLAPYGERCTVVAAAAGKVAIPEVTFHKNATAGLSGLGESPFGVTERLIKVPCLNLAEYCAAEGLQQIDFLKIDAEGYDFEVLEGFDFQRIKPRLVLVEYGTHFSSQSIVAVNEALRGMEGLGYRAVIFSYDDDGAFKKGVWSYRLTDLFINAALPEDRTRAFGNILFYREGDKEFLVSLMAMLDFCKPRDAFWSGLLNPGIRPAI